MTHGGTKPKTAARGHTKDVRGSSAWYLVGRRRALGIVVCVLTIAVGVEVARHGAFSFRTAMEAVACATMFAVGTQIGIRRVFPTLRRPVVRSIGVYEGSSPIALHPRNPDDPVELDRLSVTDVPARFVADPFILRRQDRLYAFFEVWNERTNHGDIALATAGLDGEFKYERIVLDEPFHLAYPYVFEANEAVYMVPNTVHANSVRLYRANPFPEHWQFERELLTGIHMDVCVLEHEGHWYLFSCTDPFRNGVLRLYHGPSHAGPFVEHARSPIVNGNPRIARGGGRAFHWNGKTIRLAQDCLEDYGLAVRAIEILHLTPNDYEERELSESPILTGTGTGWNAFAMHTADPVQVRDGEWLALVDGGAKHLKLSK